MVFQHVAARPLRTRLVLLVSFIVVLLVALTACDEEAHQTTRLSPSPSASPTRTASLPPLAPERGWHTVLPLGTASGGVQQVGGAFVAAKPYRIFFACLGTGSLTLGYGERTQTVPCSATPQVNGADGPPADVPGQQVQVEGSTTAGAIWEALVEMPD